LSGGVKAFGLVGLNLGKLDEDNEGMGNALNEALNSEHHKNDNRG